MNTPFVCESMVNGSACGKPCSYVYKSAHVMRLVCDVCAHELQTVKGALGPAPVVEYALLELVPARAALLEEKRLVEQELQTVRAAKEMLHTSLTESLKREDLHERAGMMIAYWLWVAIGYGVVATLVGVYEWLHR